MLGKGAFEKLPYLFLVILSLLVVQVAVVQMVVKAFFSLFGVDGELTPFVTCLSLGLFEWDVAQNISDIFSSNDAILVKVVSMYLNEILNRNRQKLTLKRQNSFFVRGWS